MNELICDIDIGRWLGYSQQYAVRSLIRRNRAELEGSGVVGAVQITYNRFGGLTANQYWLNLGQLLIIAMLGQTRRSRDIRFTLIKIMTCHGHLAESKPEDLAVIYRVVDDIQQFAAPAFVM